MDTQVRTKRAADRAKDLPKDPSLAFCYGMLNAVSRSFAVVIQQLPEELRDAVCVFYLVLRALDTVEDDMALPEERKLPLLERFHRTVGDEEFRMDDCGDGHYKELMMELPKVAHVFGNLKKKYRNVIVDITKRMGQGMAEFIPKQVDSVDDYDQYCHYVAGLVGIGLSELFVASGLENRRFRTMDELSNSMGLFLQKTNIIRDYLEDILEEPAPRMFWPRKIWEQYADNLEDFKEGGNQEQAVMCLNHMIADALSHAPDCLNYMSQLQDQSVFRFCAIPQIMAIITLALCYDNVEVFKGVVKMRRGLTARVLVNTHDMNHVLEHFHTWANVIGTKALAANTRGDPTAEDVMAEVEAIKNECKRYGYVELGERKSYRNLVLWLLAVAYFLLVFKGSSSMSTFHIDSESTIHQAIATLVLVLTSLFILS